MLDHSKSNGCTSGSSSDIAPAGSNSHSKKTFLRIDKEIEQFLVFTHVMRRPFWCTKQWQNVAQVLHNNRIKFPKDFFRYCSVHQHGRRDVT